MRRAEQQLRPQQRRERPAAAVGGAVSADAGELAAAQREDLEGPIAAAGKGSAERNPRAAGGVGRVARIFYTKVWLRTPAAERPELLETGFDAWLADEFVPRALDAVKRRKKGQAAKKM